jgi:NTE family protein
MVSPQRRRLLLATVAAAALPPKLVTSADAGRRAAGSGKIAICFGSGAKHGFAHVGAVRAFEDNGLVPDVITGTSAGAIAGVLWAAGHDAAAISRITRDASWHEASGLRLPSLGFGTLESLRQMIDAETGHRRIEDLPTRFAALATDLDSGQAVTLAEGPTGRAVQASSAVPIRYEPVTVNGRRLIDGALTAPVPVDAARALGADFVIAIDVAYRPYEETVSGISGVAFQMFHIMVNRLIEEQIQRADFAIRLDVHQAMQDEVWVPDVIRAGERAVRRQWPALQDALAQAGIVATGARSHAD